MEPVPFKVCQNQLQTLEYSPILGNINTGRASQLQKPGFTATTRQRVNTFSSNQSAASAARRLSYHKLTPRKRLFSESEITSPEPDIAQKMAKPNQEAPDMNSLLAAINSVHDKLDKVESDAVNTEQRIIHKLENNFAQLSDQMTDLRTRHDKEVEARVVLEEKVNTMSERFEELNTKVDKKIATTAEDIVPLIQAEVSRQMRTKDNQINATYFQSLANDLKMHEKDLMIYGFQSDGSPDLEPQIKQKVFKGMLDMDISNFKALQVGSASNGKPKPIRVSLPSVEIRNSICRQARNLPRDIRIDKCLPARYRQPHRDFREYSWQLREAANVETRVVFKGHKLILEFKQQDADGIKYDWTIAKEYFPEPVSPTDRTEVFRDRQGLQPSKTIEEIGTNKVLISNLTVNSDAESTLYYFKNVFVQPEDRSKVGEINTDKLTSKKIMIVSFDTKQDCSDFKTKYEKLDFNGKKPRISVMLGLGGN